MNFPPANLVEVAAGLGGHGVEVRGRDALEWALYHAFAQQITLMSAAVGAKAYDGRI